MLQSRDHLKHIPTNFRFSKMFLNHYFYRFCVKKGVNFFFQGKFFKINLQCISQYKFCWDVMNSGTFHLTVENLLQNRFVLHTVADPDPRFHVGRGLSLIHISEPTRPY